MVTPKPRGLIEEALLRKWIDSRDHFLSGPTCSPSRGYMVDVGWFAVSNVDGGLMVVSATPFLRIWPPHAHTGSFSLTSRPVSQGQGNRMGIISCINVCGKYFSDHQKLQEALTRAFTLSSTFPSCHSTPLGVAVLETFFLNILLLSVFLYSSMYREMLILPCNLG